MIIGVTGGCGYIASQLLPQLSTWAGKIEFLDIRKPDVKLLAGLNPQKYRFIQMDISDAESFQKVATRYDVIIHLSALVGYPACNENPELAERYNVIATENVMKFKKKHCPVLFASTISNYGPHSGIVDESTPVQPLSLYSDTKIRGEKLVLSQPGNIVFRFAGAFGVAPVMRHDNLIHDFVSKAVSGETLSIYESHFLRQFVHVNDMVGAILFALKHWEHMQNEIFNVGNPKIEITKRDVVEMISRFIAFEHRFENSGNDAEKRNYPVSFEKIMKLGFRPRMELAPAIAELITHYQNDSEETSHVTTTLAA